MFHYLAHCESELPQPPAGLIAGSAVGAGTLVFMATVMVVTAVIVWQKKKVADLKKMKHNNQVHCDGM